MDYSLNDAPCIFFATQKDGLILEINERLCGHLGFERETLIGQKVDKIFTLATRIFQQTHLFPLLSMQQHAEELFITLQKNGPGSLPVLVNAERQGPAHDPEFVYTGIVVENRKKFEDELVAAKKAAEKALNENTMLLEAKKALQQNAEKLDEQLNFIHAQNTELLQFNKVVTHDLQEPLRKLAVFIDMLPEDSKKDARIGKIKSALSQMSAIVHGLQQYIWLTENTVTNREVDLETVLSGAKLQIETENPGVDLAIISEPLPCVPADREQMSFLFHEILANAIRFSKPGMAPEVRINASTLLRNKFTNYADKYRYVNFLKLEFRDNGIGFDPAYKMQVFELFRRLHPNSGRSVGLSLCKKIVLNHQGRIDIDSRPEKGTTLTIWLPLETLADPLPQTKEII